MCSSICDREKEREKETKMEVVGSCCLFFVVWVCGCLRNVYISNKIFPFQLN